VCVEKQRFQVDLVQEVGVYYIIVVFLPIKMLVFNQLHLTLLTL